MKIRAYFEFIADSVFEPERLHDRINVSADGGRSSVRCDRQTAINCLYKILAKFWKDVPEKQLPFVASDDWWQEQFSKENYREILFSAVAQLKGETPLTAWEDAAAKSLYGSRKYHGVDRYEREMLGYLWKIYCSPPRMERSLLYPEDLERLDRHFHQNILPQKIKEMKNRKDNED